MYNKIKNNIIKKNVKRNKTKSIFVYIINWYKSNYVINY